MGVYPPTGSTAINTVTLNYTGSSINLTGAYIWVEDKCYIVTDQTLDSLLAKQCFLQQQRATVLEAKPQKAQPHWAKYNDWRKKAKR